MSPHIRVTPLLVTAPSAVRRLPTPARAVPLVGTALDGLAAVAAGTCFATREPLLDLAAQPAQLGFTLAQFIDHPRLKGDRTRATDGVKTGRCARPHHEHHEPFLRGTATPRRRHSHVTTITVTIQPSRTGEPA